MPTSRISAGSQPVLRWSHPRLLGLVGLGGAIGSLLRFGVGQLFSSSYSFFGTLIVNILGCFILGFLTETLSHWGTETARTQQIRLLIGTGICGGFTTYSTFALDTATLAGMVMIPGGALVTLGYVLGTFALGTLAVLLGIWLGAYRRHRPSDISGNSEFTPQSNTNHLPKS